MAAAISRDVGLRSLMLSFWNFPAWVLWHIYDLIKHWSFFVKVLTRCSRFSDELFERVWPFCGVGAQRVSDFFRKAPSSDV